MKDDKYIFLPHTILGLSCSSSITVTGNIQLNETHEPKMKQARSDERV